MVPRKRHTETIAECYQRLANLRLEQNDDRDTDVQQSVAENELERCEILFDGKPVKENDGGEAGGHGRGASTAQEFQNLSLIHISEPTRLLSISYAVFCLKKKKK